MSLIKPKIKLLFYNTYLASIKNSAKSKIFRHLYALVDNRKKDITENGRLSCAFFVSGILRIFGLINKICPTVHILIKELKKFGWRKIKRPKPGAIIIWQSIKFKDGSIHKHAGFYLGKNKAISNSRKKRCPVIHHWTYGFKNGRSKRQIKAIFWHEKLNKKSE